MEVRFSPGDDPIILVLMVSSGQKARSTAMPAMPPATPCFKSAIIIFQPNQSIILGNKLPVLPQAIVEASLLLLVQSSFLKFHASSRTNLESLFEGAFVFGVGLEEGLDVLYFLLSGLAQELHYIIIMQHPTLTLIIRYPNDTLHLATQDHLKNKVIIKCESCGQIEVVQKNTRETVCKSCGVHSKIEATKGQNCRKQNCNGQLKLMMMATGMMVEQCSVCDYREIVNMR